MKRLALESLALGASEVLTRAQLKNVLGGRNVPPVGSSPCAADGFVCHVADGLTYTCSTEWSGEEVANCCCSHSAYNSVCGG